MPIQFPNFGNIPYVKPDYSGIVDFIPNALKVYTETNEAIENPFKLRHERMMNEQKLQEQMMKNALEKLYGPRTREAEIASKEAYARNLLNPMTSTQKDLISAFGSLQSPEAQRAMKAQYGIYDNQTSPNDFIEKGIPPEVIGRSFNNMSKGQANEAYKRMSNNLRINESQSDVLPILTDMEKIMKDNPHLWKSLAVVLENPEDKTAISYAKRNIVNPNDKTKIDMFNKLSSDLIATGGESFGSGQRFTDARQALLKEIKPDIRNTAEANLYVIEKIRKKAQGAPLYAKALREGIKNGYEIIPNQELFRQLADESEQGQPLRLGIPSDSESMSRGAQNIAPSKGKIYTTDDPEVQKTAKKYNMAPEDVVMKLNKQRYR